MGKSVCFTGHRILGNDFDINLLRSYVTELIQNEGASTFIVGGALGFDTVVAEEILALKKSGCEIELHVYVPCSNQSAKWSERDKKRYENILKQADYVDAVNEPYFDGCMRIRNYKMVDNADFCICYFTGKPSGTLQTVSYARKKGLKVLNTCTKQA